MTAAPASAPPTAELFRDDPYRRTCHATVTGVGPSGIRLDCTVFYPLGGGQPGDTGALRTQDGRTVRIVDTVKDPADGQPVHVPEAGAPPLGVGETVSAEIDWDRRHRHMRMHSLLHLVCAAVEGAITGASISEGKGRVDFDMGDAKPDKVALGAELNRLIVADRPLAVRRISDADLAAQPELVRTMKVKPPTGTGWVRLIDIEGVDVQPCGGTHVRSTAEIGPVRIAKIESKGRQNRRITVAFDEP